MGVYLARRALLAAPTLILVSVLVFSLMHLIPGDAVIARLQEIGVVTDETLNAMRRELGLDKPFHRQLGDWLWGCFPPSAKIHGPTILHDSSRF
jgi:ABC-type dipeptide/oligopeptide/nickel transport system permease component